MKKIFILPLFFVFIAQAQHVCMDMTMVTTNSGAQNGVYDDNSKWTNGRVITIKFLGGSPYVRSKIIIFSKEWENYANVSFDFVQNNSLPDVLISFNPSSGSWSYVGTKSKYFTSQNLPSMNFGWFNENTSDEDFRETTLHEFGHMLGLMHEHQNPLGTIHWNVPYVRNWCATHIGWSPEKTDLQIINKYSVTLTNHKYDRLSIMHYWVDADWTMDYVGIPPNKNLSEEDKELISEMYPFETTIQKRTSPNKIQTSSEKVVIEHNITQNGVLGLLVKTTFQISNALGKTCRLSAYFYDNDGKPLKDKNDKYHSVGGNVSTGRDFVPIYEASQYNSFELFMPYDELDLSNGEYKLKFNLTIWDNQTNDIFNSGSYYFDYHKGIVVQEVSLNHIADDNHSKYIIYPKFRIKYAQNTSLKVCLFLYDQQTNLAVRDVTLQHSTTEGSLYYYTNITPGFENAYYNFSSIVDFSIEISYSDLYKCLGTGQHQLKYFVSIRDLDDNEVGQSDWDDLSIRFGN